MDYNIYFGLEDGFTSYFSSVTGGSHSRLFYS